jgi:hypothetical protein
MESGSSSMVSRVYEVTFKNALVLLGNQSHLFMLARYPSTTIWASLLRPTALEQSGCLRWVDHGRSRKTIAQSQVKNLLTVWSTGFIVTELGSCLQRRLVIKELAMRSG